jgi:hypothetical protein
MSNGGDRPHQGKAAQMREAAEGLAIDALTFIAADPARLERFIALSGLSVDDLRAAAAEPGFFSAVLDFIASDEAQLLAFAANGGFDPATVAKARQSFEPPGATF